MTQQIDFVKFQVQELEQAKLEGVDETELAAEHTRTANAQRILELCAAIRGGLSEDESSAFHALASVQQQLGELANLAPEANNWKQEAAALAGQAQELARAVGDFVEKVNADPERLQWLEEWMATLHRLKRKYGGGAGRQSLRREQERPRNPHVGFHRAPHRLGARRGNRPDAGRPGLDECDAPPRAGADREAGGGVAAPRRSAATSLNSPPAARTTAPVAA